MNTFTDDALYRLAAELQRAKQDTERLEIGDGIHIIYDKADTWFGIGDDDWTSYDQAGGVAMDVKMIDVLIEKLQQVKATLRGRPEAAL